MGMMKEIAEEAAGNLLLANSLMLMRIQTDPDLAPALSRMTQDEITEAAATLLVLTSFKAAARA
jgi:hypothetical protein